MIRLNRAGKILALVLCAAAAGCVCRPPGKLVPRKGDEIMVAGQLFHTGARVVLWSDPGGFDAYRVERRFAPWEKADWEHSRTNLDATATPNRYGVRANGLSRGVGAGAGRGVGFGVVAEESGSTGDSL